MILLPNHIQPSTNALDKLQQYQAQVDALATFTERSEKAKSLFSSTNKIGNVTFDEVKEKLIAMCPGVRRCMYCEDSVADEVEHIRPKSLYPGDCFKWENYLYACGNCNGPKNDKFAIFRQSDGAFVSVNTPRGTPIVEPPAGEDVLINPREENPLDYCILDIGETFKFVVLKPTGSKEAQRAEYTFNEVLRLNKRAFLVEARKNAYENYKNRLRSYHAEKQGVANQHKLSNMIKGIQTEAHPTVWKEMQRYYTRGWLGRTDMELWELFNNNTEALKW